LLQTMTRPATGTNQRGQINGQIIGASHYRRILIQIMGWAGKCGCSQLCISCICRRRNIRPNVCVAAALAMEK